MAYGSRSYDFDDGRNKEDQAINPSSIPLNPLGGGLSNFSVKSLKLTYFSGLSAVESRRIQRTSITYGSSFS
jgi:hypothetical protein